MPNRTTQNTDADRTDNASLSAHTGHTQGAGDAGNAESALPWYKDGLQFECTQCGDCCTGGPGAVWVSDEELAEIAAELEKTLGEVRLLYTKLMGGRWSLRDYPNGDCVFLDPHTRHCGVYSARPMQCRTWPFWPSNIASSDSWKRTCGLCPGAGAGTLHPLEIIQRQSDACDI